MYKIQSICKKIIRSRLGNLIFFLFNPTLFYFGERSYIAFDEGYYTLQAKWILETGNWLAPMWWDSIYFDRTNAIQSLIAISQILFGQNSFSAHLPSYIASIIVLYMSFLITKDLLELEYPWLTIIILCTTYLWVDYAHLATQDMPLLALETIGIYFLLKSNKNPYLIVIFGISIGLAFYLKTVMIFFPCLALTPYLIYQRKFISYNFLFIGLILGFVPFCIWYGLSAIYFGTDATLLLFKKIIYLSESDSYSQPFYYYLWNLPLNTFPWILVSLFGAVELVKRKAFKVISILLIYPFLLVVCLSVFKTKTPYYLLQITPFIAINANFAIHIFFQKQYKKIATNVFVFIAIILISIAIILLSNNAILVFGVNAYTLPFLLFLWGFSWLFLCLINSPKYMQMYVLIIPFLFFSLLVQQGIFSNRDPMLKSELLAYYNSITAPSKMIFVIPDDELSSSAHSKLIKLALYTPYSTERVRGVDFLERGDLAWIDLTNNLQEEENSLSILNSDNLFYPWALVKRAN